MNENRFGKRDFMRRLNDAMFSLNLGFSIAYSVLTYLTAPLSRGEELETKIVARTSALFSLQSRSSIALELGFLAAMLAVGLSVFALMFLLRLAPFSLKHRVWAAASGILVLAAAPALWEYALRTASRYVFWWSDYPAWPARSPWLSMGLEVSLIITIVYSLRKRQIAFWYSVLPVLAHYLYWALWMWPGMSHAFPFSAPKVCFLACPISGLTWLHCLRYDP